MERKPLTAKKIAKILTLLSMALILSFLVSIASGVSDIGFYKAISSFFSDEKNLAKTIIFNIRLPRFAIGAMAGWALGISGAVFQGILRNPLADSYVLGVASGAAFGAVLSIFLGIDYAFFGIPLYSLLGALFSVFVVYYIARVDGKLNTGRMILAGIIVGTFFSAGVSFIISVVPYSMLGGIVFWLLGDLSTQDMGVVKAIAPYVTAGSVPLIVYSNHLNILSLGEDGAEQLGLKVKRSLAMFFLFASLLTSTIVSVCGIIGFVGLIVPHIIRIIFGPDYRLLVPAAGIAGAAFLVFSDILARTVIVPQELPIGVVTAFIGAPFFLYLLRWKRR